MVSRRARANHLNAQKRTGPRSIKGKQRSAKNAFRHGLSLPVMSDQELCKEVDRLALIIAGEETGLRCQEAARHIAEQQIALIRLRRARLLLLNTPGERMNEAILCEKIEIARLLLDRPKDLNAILCVQDTIYRLSGAKAATIATGLDILAPKLMRLDRYERRALSRRKKAIIAFDLILSHELSDKTKENSDRVQINVGTKSSQRIAGEYTS